MKLKPFQIFAPIERVDEDARTVEAYAFVNEVVEGEGGMRLKRTAMEAATPGYMTWANVRRMHQPDAVGVAKAVDWDEKGARMTLEVVDDDAWEKVKRGVYKGLSVGVAGTVVRGKDVESCRWFETSLVDRPKDPGARILAFRAEGVTDDAEFEADELPADPGADETPHADAQRGMTSADVPARENLEGGKPRKMTVYDCGNEYCRHTTGGGAQECMENQAASRDRQIAELEQYVKTLKARKRAEGIEDGGEQQPEEDAPALLARIETLQGDNTQLLARAEAAEGELARVQGLLSSAEERVRVLQNRPAPQKPPVRFPHALERTFAANEEEPEIKRALDARAEIKRLSDLAKNEPDEAKRSKIAEQMIAKQAELYV